MVPSNPAQCLSEFGPWDFGFLSVFGLRISDFGLTKAGLRPILEQACMLFGIDPVALTHLPVL